jgi:DNA (cytosine-5)-methyltransferase 1
MRHGSLFSGIGGFDLAAEWMGWTNVFHVERDPFCQRVLAHHFPSSQGFNDVKTFDGRPFRGHVDILTGGFPCQPYSTAGKRLGKDDERHLWPEMCRIILEVAPAYVVGENVRGLLNWNGGVVFDEVCADLEYLGYEVWTGILPAAGVGAPHRRDRIWWIAYHPDHYRTMRGSQKDASQGGAERLQERDAVQRSDEPSGVRNVGDTNGTTQGTLETLCGGQDDEPAGVCQRYASDTNCGGLEGTTQSRRDSIDVERKGIPGDATDTSGTGLQGGQFIGAFEGGKWKQGEARFPASQLHQVGNWEHFPTQPPVCGGDDGLPRELDGVTFSKWRTESIKAYGNAIVPQLAFQLFRAIELAHP